jgi:hypothetical protein
MKYWPAQRWSFRTSLQGTEGCQELPQPFALIGSHPRCHVRLEYKRLPPVVYLAVCYGKRIEVWPLCAVAYPAWGPIRGKTPLLVGGTRVHLVGESDAGWAAAQPTQPGDAVNDFTALPENVSPAADLIMDWGDGPQARKLNRRVSILGEDHPSLMRMHGLALRRCELGIVCAGERVWAIQLNPDALAADEPLVRELVPGERSAWVGHVHLWANQPGPVATARFGSLLRPAHEAAGGNGKAAGNGSSNGQASPSADEVEPDDWSPAIDTAETGPQVDADRFAAHFTNRLLAKTEERAKRETMLQLAAYGSLLLASLAVVTFILMLGIVPVFRAIYAD